MAARYRLDGLLGTGGTSEVWRAWDERLDRPVAVKVLKSQLAVGPILERVTREARSAAALRHPGVVEIYDLGQLDSGMPLIVMEFLRGRSVRALMDRRGPLAATDAIGLMLPVIDALQAAHEQGIVHRDIKPENIFVARLPRGILQPKVLDFGVAHVSAPANRRLTMVGALVGTPPYMSPEQAGGMPHLDGKTDVWAVGVTLYEMIVGRLPFDGETMDDLFGQIHAAPLPFPRDAKEVDGRLFSLLAAATRKEPRERPTAAVLMGELVHWMTRRGETVDLTNRHLSTYVEAPPPPPSSDASAPLAPRTSTPLSP